MEEKTFRDNLWDGFEAVFARVTQGRHDLKRFKAYLDERAKIEETYSKALQKSVMVPDFETTSSVSQTWKDVKKITTDQGKQHEQFGKTCSSISAALEKMIVEIKQTKTKLHSNFEKLKKDKTNKSEAHTKAKTSYYNAVKEAETAFVNRSQGQSQNLPPKNLQKLEQRVNDTMKAVETSHANYKKSVDELKKSEEAFDAGVADMLHQFEDLERRRMKFLHDQVAQFSELHLFVKGSLEQVHLFLSQSLQAVNIPKDIQDFIQEKTTGSAPLPHVVYEPCKSQIIEQPHIIQTSASASAFSAESKQQPPAAPSMNANASASNFVAAPQPPAAPALSASSTGPTAVALYDFAGTEAEDLTFAAGDVIQLMSHDDSSDWWQGSLRGKQGMFPKAYVQRQAGASETPLQTQTLQVEDVSAQQSQPQQVEGQVEGEPAASGEPEHKKMDARCIALYDFPGQDADELSFSQDEELIITGELNGWYLGKSLDGSRVGIFPSNYVRIL